MKTTIKNIGYTTLISLFLGFGACSNLDEEVYSYITEATYKYEPGDATKIVGAVYANMRGYYGFHTYFAQQICTDETVQPANASGWDDGGVFRRMHQHMWNAEQDHVWETWKFNFTGILLSNRVLEQLNSSGFPFSTKENKESMIAEVRALRAFHYWQIMDNFGDGPLLTEPTNELPKKATRKEIYDFVVKELTEVMNSLPENKTVENYGRFTKWGAKALLANVYLNAEVYTGTANWTGCISECNDIINSGKYQMDADYTTPFSTNNETSQENILVNPFDQIYATGFNYYHVSLHSANQKTYNTEDSPWGAGSYRGVPQFIDTYDKDDQRLSGTWLYGPQFASDGTELTGAYDQMGKPLDFINKMPDGIYTGEAEGYRWLKYEIAQGSKHSLNNDFVVFRLTQVYMMKAECLLRTGNADEAAEIVTKVRERAFKDNPAKAKVTGSQLHENSSYVYGMVNNYVLTPQGGKYPEQFGRFYDELGWEFAGEMNRRRDMIRFGHFTKVQWLSHDVSKDFRSVFPIPQRVVDANPNLEQNPNYIQ